MTLRLNTLLREAGHDPAACTVMLHTPKEKFFRTRLGDVFVRRRSVFERYQSSHYGPATATLRKRPFTLSFVGQEDGTCVFAALYAVRDIGPRDPAEIDADPDVVALRDEFGLDYDVRTDQTFFALTPRPEMAEFSGRLVIAPPRTRAYVRLAENLDAEVLALSRESLFDAPITDWRKLVLSGPELRVIGPRAAARLAEWRGIYMITDDSDGARYVGSAYGETNLLGRWQAHVARDQGVTAMLQHRDPVDFRFAILERVSPDMPAEDVIRLERTWMDRLHTIRHGLNS